MYPVSLTSIVLLVTFGFSYAAPRAGTCNVDGSAQPECDGRSLYFPHESDCSKFWFCGSDQMPCLFQCPPISEYLGGGTLLFNAKFQTCDWPHLVDCPEPQTTTEVETTTSEEETTTMEVTEADTTTQAETEGDTSTAEATEAETTIADVTEAETTTAEVTVAETTTTEVTEAETITAEVTDADTTTQSETEGDTTTSEATVAETTTAEGTKTDTTTAEATESESTTQAETEGSTTTDVTEGKSTTAEATEADTATAAATEAETTTAMTSTLYATCDNFMRIYFDGRLVFEDENYGTVSRPWKWTITTSLRIPTGTKVIGISCLDAGGAKGIIASTSNGLKTDTNWLCTSQSVGDWAMPNSTAHFQNSVTVGRNGDNPWGNRQGISGSAEWIWVPGGSEWAACKTTLNKF